MSVLSSLAVDKFVEAIPYIIFAIVSGIVGFVWKTNMAQLAKLERDIEELDRELEKYATKESVRMINDYLHNILNEIKMDLRNGFQSVNDRIDKIKDQR